MTQEEREQGYVHAGGDSFPIKGMDMDTAVRACTDGGQLVKLPEWDGFWYWDEGVKVFTADCKTLDTPWFDSYKDRHDFMITDGSRTFAGALKGIFAGAKLYRNGWNGKNTFLFLVNEERMTINLGIYGGEVKIGSYIAMKTTRGEVFPWTPSQEDMAASDWQVIDEEVGVSSIELAEMTPTAYHMIVGLTAEVDREVSTSKMTKITSAASSRMKQILKSMSNAGLLAEDPSSMESQHLDKIDARDRIMFSVEIASTADKEAVNEWFKGTSLYTEGELVTPEGYVPTVTMKFT